MYFVTKSKTHLNSKDFTINFIELVISDKGSIANTIAECKITVYLLFF